MPGLSLEYRYQLVRAVEQCAIAGGGLTPADARVIRALAFDFHNGGTGRCDPGHRAIAARARCAISTVTAAIRRLRAAGVLTWQARWLRSAGRWVRWTHAYALAAVVPALRSEAGAKPQAVKKEAQERPRSVAAQIRAALAWQAEWEARR